MRNKYSSKNLMQDKKSSLFIESCLFVRSSFTVDADCALYTKILHICNGLKHNHTLITDLETLENLAHLLLQSQHNELY